MSRDLPPLNALRAFEAAARHLSFTLAAEELFVTQSAVSHQIKTLEQYLGVPLFRRLTRSLTLTAAGQDYFPTVRRALDDLSKATGRLTELETSGILSVSMTASVAAKWLVPRLPRFQAQYPDIDVRLLASDRLVDFDREDVDVCLRQGFGKWPGMDATLMFREYTAPVCSPRLQEGRHPLRQPSDLRHHVLVHDEWAPMIDVYPTWEGWLAYAGVTDVDPRHGPRFSHTMMALQAAMDGQGVALGPEVLVTEDLAAGRLVTPFDIRMPTGIDYYTVCPTGDTDRPKVKIFRDWLHAEAALVADVPARGATPTGPGRPSR